MKEIISSHLREDLRVRQPPRLSRRIFKDAHYEVHLKIYPELPKTHPFFNTLATCQIVYLDEDLSILLKLWAEEVVKDPEAYFRQIVDKLEAQGKGPYEFVRDGKVYCNIPLTENDQAALEAVGVKFTREL